jgi:photosystem II stability/assembly factor-like uncharacterized protein
MNINNFTFMNSANRLLLGTRKGLFILERRNDGWDVTQSAFPGVPIPYAMRDPRTGTLWASLDHGHWAQKLHRSDDGGVTWEEVMAPKYPEGAEIKEGEPATARYLWVLAPGGADEPERFYIGTEPGGLFRSEDGGRSFQLVESLWNHPSRKDRWFGGGRDYPGIHSIFVDPRDSRRVLVGVSCAGVFETRDGGATWEPRNRGLNANFLPNPEAEVGHDPHLMVSCPSSPDALWQQNHCGIFRSEDGGMSWRDVSETSGPAGFGFAIAVDENDPGTAWVVPAHSDQQRMAIDGALCVCRTEDGGRSWKALRQGLPQQHCYDVAFRHALDVSGSRLAFGTTTGNLFVSEDRGDSWDCIGNYFPPVYSVRFMVGNNGAV